MPARVNRGFGTSQLLDGQIDEMFRQQRDVVLSLLQRGDVDGKDMEPVIKVFAETARRHFLLQVRDWWRAMMRTSAWRVRSSPTRS